TGSSDRRRHRWRRVRTCSTRAGVARVGNAYERGVHEPSLLTLQTLVAGTGKVLELKLRDEDGCPELPNTATSKLILERRSALLDAAARHGASNVRVFGSVARGSDRPDSDIDLLV